MRFFQIRKNNAAHFAMWASKKLSVMTRCRGEFAGNNARHDFTQGTDVIFRFFNAVADLDAPGHQVGTQVCQRFLVQEAVR